MNSMHNFAPLWFALESLVIPALCCLGFSLIFAAGLRVISAEHRFLKILNYYFWFALPVSLIAFLAGILTGLSRSSAVGSVLAAVLALFAGLIVYVFGSDNRFKLVVGYCAFIFVFTLFTGIQVGSYERISEKEEYLKYLSEQEFRVRAFRKNLGLPEDMPAWVSGSDSK